MQMHRFPEMLRAGGETRPGVLVAIQVVLGHLEYKKCSFTAVASIPESETLPFREVGLLTCCRTHPVRLLGSFAVPMALR